MSFFPTTAMIFAAGLGTRMRPLTDILPKPLVKLCGKTLIDWRLDKLVEAGVARVVVNTHYKADLLKEHLRQRRDIEIAFSHEDVLLETGGGLVKALPLLGNEPFFLLNSDTVWLDEEDLPRPFTGEAGLLGEHSEPRKPGGGISALPPSPPLPRKRERGNALKRLAEAWNPAAMDELLLVQPRERAFSYTGEGDFGMDAKGRLLRPDAPRPYVFAGIQIFHPARLKNYKAEPFSRSILWWNAPREDGALARIHGLEHTGEWISIDTPQDIAAAEQHLRKLLK